MCVLHARRGKLNLGERGPVPGDDFSRTEERYASHCALFARCSRVQNALHSKSCACGFPTPWLLRWAGPAKRELVDISSSWIPFGGGRHACVGRCVLAIGQIIALDVHQYNVDVACV